MWIAQQIAGNKLHEWADTQMFLVIIPKVLAFPNIILISAADLDDSNNISSSCHGEVSSTKLR